jgi:putative N-acylglucosamine-6-phosphate 2-epimerase
MCDRLMQNLHHSLIVSCQSEGDDPFNENPEYMALFARAVEMGGAKGIRTQGIKKLKAIKRACSLPVIGLLKSQFADGTVKITGSFSEVEQLIEAGSDIIAIDGTFRIRENLTGPDFIAEVKNRYGRVVLADIATYEEAIACSSNGVDCISTTLNGYTPDTLMYHDGPNLALLEDIVKNIDKPIFAEGRYNTPKDAYDAIQLGAHAVITGTAITRPRVVTSWFVEAISKTI